MSQADYRETLAELLRELPTTQVGIGSVRAAKDVARAKNAGASFAVTPVLVPGAAAVAQEAEIPLVQGAATPSEIHQAWLEGSDVVKVFPADCLGGPRFVRSILAPMPELAVMPSGGVEPADVEAYLSAGACCVGLGSSIAPPGALEARDADAVRASLALLQSP